MFAALRTLPGIGRNTAKRGGGIQFFPDSCPRNIQSFLQRWPSHLTGDALAVREPAPGKSHAGLVPFGRPRPYGSQTTELPKDEPDRLEPAALPADPNRAKKFGVHSMALKRARQQPISVVTAYDYPSARLADAAGMDVVLVGDSLGMVVLGRPDTTSVTMAEMVHHCAAAARGVRRALLVGDLPFGSCLTPAEAARNGVRLVKEGRVDAVKIEGGERVACHVRALADAGCAVVGHIGLTPQSHLALGGYRVQGRTCAEALRLVRDAEALQAAGACALVLEMVPSSVAREVTRRVSLPTIGIGAGPHTSGQVQVYHDLLGLYDGKVPCFSGQFASLGQETASALAAYADAVECRVFPAPRHCFHMAAHEETRFRDALPPAECTPPLDAPHAPPHGNAAPETPSGPDPASSRLVAPAAGATRVLRTVSEWRSLRSDGLLPPRASLGLVPTMGAVHAGHLSLVAHAARDNDLVAATIFVNPTQFGAAEELGAYPRPWEDDLELLTAAGVDYVFAPSVNEMYPPARHGTTLAPYVELRDADTLCAEGARRPGHFRGVATVVAKLLNIVQPRSAYFGQKDGMQAIAVRRLIEDLNYDVRLRICDTVREADGLAMSSRNVRLLPLERAEAPAVYAALCAMREAHAAGERRAEALAGHARDALRAAPLLRLEYISLASTLDGRELDLLPDEREELPSLASIAVFAGETRLLDNVLLE